MKKIATLLFASTAAFALAGCGSSDSADEQAAAENVEMPAEEAVADVQATPAADASATASDAASASPEASATPTAGASGAAEAATAAAEKKM